MPGGDMVAQVRFTFEVRDASPDAGAGEATPQVKGCCSGLPPQAHVEGQTPQTVLQANCWRFPSICPFASGPSPRPTLHHGQGQQRVEWSAGTLTTRRRTGTGGRTAQGAFTA